MTCIKFITIPFSSSLFLCFSNFHEGHRNNSFFPRQRDDSGNNVIGTHDTWVKGMDYLTFWIKSWQYQLFTLGSIALFLFKSCSLLVDTVIWLCPSQLITKLRLAYLKRSLTVILSTMMKWRRDHMSAILKLNTSAPACPHVSNLVRGKSDFACKALLWSASS